MSAAPKIGLALGAGGARGWCHIGVLRALEELGVAPDMVAGCSMGALVGAAWAGGKLDALEDWARALTPTRFVRLLDIRLNSGGLLEAAHISALLDELGLADRIEDLPRPFVAVATDMQTGHEIWLREGPTGRAVRASVTIPGIFTPVLHEGRWLLDGGLINPLPVSAARALGADIIIAVNPNGHDHGVVWNPDRRSERRRGWAGALLPGALREAFHVGRDAREVVAPGYLDVVNAAVDVMADQIRRVRLASEPPHLLLTAILQDIMVLEFYHAAEAIDEGRRVVEAQADEIRELLRLEG